MAPSPYSHLAQDPSDTSELLAEDSNNKGGAGGSTSLHFPLPLPPHPPILFGSNTSLPSSQGSYKDEEEEKQEEDRFVQEGVMESGSGRAGRGWRAVEAGGGRRSLLKSKPRRRRPYLVMICLIFFAGIVGTLAALGWVNPKSRAKASKLRQHLTMDHVMNGTFGVQRKGVSWVKEAGDGIFSTESNGNVLLEDVNDVNSTQVLLNGTLIVDSDGKKIEWNSWTLSPDMKFILLQTGRVQQWRHSSHANFYIHSLLSNATFPLLPPTYPPTVAYATWAPVGHAIAFVESNDLYVLPESELGSESVGEIVRITTDGSEAVFNGVPDWVYEEEVFGADYALWFSPNGEEVAFLRSDETEVPTYEFPLYDENDDGTIQPYPKEIVMKYPKPGYPNPLVSLRLFSLKTLGELLSSSFEPPSVLASQATKNLTWPDSKPITNSVIFEVTWIGRRLLVKESDRSAASGNVVLFDVDDAELVGGTLRGEVVRKLDGGKGWIEQSQTVVAYGNGYLDIDYSAEGFKHIAYFTPDSSTPTWITTGEWEVAGGILAVDARKKLVYFTAAQPSIERHIFSAALPSLSDDLSTFESLITPLTDTSRPGYFSASFSPEAGFYVLGYEGPSVPYQKVIKADDEKFDYLLEGNSNLNETIFKFILPNSNQQIVDSDGYQLNVKEIRPPNMDETGKTKYPVLLAPYGGPGSQSVDVRFGVNWASLLAAELKYIILVVDGRGTGFKGRDLRDPIRGKLGTYEAIDQIAVARTWASTKLYVDKRRVGIWGWSFGGYLTAKCLEADSGVLSLGIAVAPVTDWRYYDTVYTERFMLTPDENPEGYAVSGVNNATGFHNADFLLAAGSGDDNVHFANSASLIEKLTLAKVRRFQMRVYTDSNHGMNKYGAYRELHEAMTAFLLEKWGVGGKRRGWSA